MRKKKKRAQQKCRKCQQPGHNAKSCTNGETPASAESTLYKHGKSRVREIAGAANGAADLVAKAQADAKAMVAQKLNEEILWAEAYLAELRRRAAS